MNPHTRHTSLFFTPRTPWGTRLTGRTFRNHMRASEDSPKPPNFLQKVGNGLGHAISNAQPFLGMDAEKAGSEHGSGGVVLGLHMGAKGGISAASDEAAKEDRIRAENQSWGMKVPAGEPESTPQENNQHVTTDQELEAGQRDWARRNAKELKQRAATSIANFHANQKQP